MLKKQFVATVYIIDQGKVLLIFHKKLQKWLPPGGHLHENELPHEGAIREAKEETGIDVELLLQENVWIDQWNAKSIPRPYLCLLEEIPAIGTEPAHQHIDMLFVAKPIGGDLAHNQTECEGVHWFSLEEITAMPGDVKIFEETKQTIQHLLKAFSDCCTNPTTP